MWLVSRMSLALACIREVCWRFCSCLRSTPLLFCVALSIIVALGSAIVFFNVFLAKLVTWPLTVLLNLAVIWFLLRLVVRALVFPGSIVLWQRSTEASYRVEIAKQFATHLAQLHAFLVQVGPHGRKGRSGSLPSITLGGVVLGCSVVESLARNFRLQQRDQVRLTAEQARVKRLVQGVETWLAEAKISDSERGESQVPLVDWLRRLSRSLVPVPQGCSLACDDVEAEAGACIGRLEQLLEILEELQRPKGNCCMNARRFLCEPPVGSLHQLRAELQVQYSGRHHWVRTPLGGRIDAMFIPCKSAALEPPGPEEEAGATDATSKEDVPLKDRESSDEQEASTFAGPTVIWCNPNAGYYETMVYEHHWLNFYVGQGCNVFLFNYSGFGRSTGRPSPAALGADGDAVIDFLRRRGVTEIGVHGRSIGGICACHLAARHPDLVKLLVADRTMSTLARVAKLTFGNWAVKGLSLSATWADNVAVYSQARCYKVLICDARDATIPDLASLRTAIAVEALRRAPPHCTLLFSDEELQRVADSWYFLAEFLSICERRESSVAGSSHISSARKRKKAKALKAAAARAAREPQLVVSDASGGAEGRAEAGGEEDMQHLVGSPSARQESQFATGTVTLQWLQEHGEEDVRNAVKAWPGFPTALRCALDVIGKELNASGATLDDTMSRPYAKTDPRYALRCFLANLQVWGSLGSMRKSSGVRIDMGMELVLRKSADAVEDPNVRMLLTKLVDSVTPEALSTYHRRLSRSMATEVLKDFRNWLAGVESLLAADSGSTRLAAAAAASAATSAAEGGLQQQVLPPPMSAKLADAVLIHLRELEEFIASINRFFQRVDLEDGQAATEPGAEALGAATAPTPPTFQSAASSPAPAVARPADSDYDSISEGGGSADSGGGSGVVAHADEGPPALPPVLPTLDRGLTGYSMMVECGHNGSLGDHELQHLSVHLRAAHFGGGAGIRGPPPVRPGGSLVHHTDSDDAAAGSCA